MNVFHSGYFYPLKTCMTMAAGLLPCAQAKNTEAPVGALLFVKWAAIAQPMSPSNCKKGSEISNQIVF